MGLPELQTEKRRILHICSVTSDLLVQTTLQHIPDALTFRYVTLHTQCSLVCHMIVTADSDYSSRTFSLFKMKALLSLIQENAVDLRGVGGVP